MIAPEFPRAASAASAAARRRTSPAVAKRGSFNPCTTAPSVNARLVPVSPSAMGKTLMRLISSRCATTLRIPTMSARRDPQTERYRALIEYQAGGVMALIRGQFTCELTVEALWRRSATGVFAPSSAGFPACFPGIGRCLRCFLGEDAECNIGTWIGARRVQTNSNSGRCWS